MARTPSATSIPPPAMESHFLNRGALLRSQPVTPPSRSMGDNVVPKPNKSATKKLSTGAPKGTEYKRSSARGGHTIKPLLRPSEKARKSNLPVFFAGRVSLFSGVQARGFWLFRRIVTPMTMVTKPKTYEEYC